MRWFICVLLLLACGQARAEDDVYYIKSRLKPSIPQIGPFWHASIAVCPAGTTPYVKDEKAGWMIKNPAVEYYGALVGYKGFQPERDLWEIKAIKVNVPADFVKERLKTYDGKWNLIRNCQAAAAYATNQRSVWWLWRKK
jgi:hypothetical protein